jgi:uncharacterized protein (TIGR00369 family)
MDVATLSAFLDDAFPSAARLALGNVVSVAPGHVRMVLDPGPETVRPGNIVSGPTLMGLIDVAAYSVVLAHIGPVAMAVTTSLTVHFLRGCRMEAIMADARLLKLGRRLATADVRLWQDSEDRLIAQSTVEYALP